MSCCYGWISTVTGPFISSLSELRVAGWSREQVLDLCRELYEQEG